jgi:hypothetical protein
MNKKLSTENVISIFVLAVIVISGFVLRFWGIKFGLPFFYMPDEPSPHILNSLKVIQAGDLLSILKVNIEFYPRMFWYIVAIFYKLAMVLGIPGGIPTILPATQDWYKMMMFISSNSQFFLTLGRFVSVFFGSLSVIVIYFLGKRWINNTVGLLSSASLAVCFMHVKDSHYMYLDVTLTFFVLLGFLFLLIYAEKRKPVYLLFAFLFTGIASGIKFNLFISALSILIFLVIDGLKRRELRKVFKAWSLYTGILIFLFAFTIGNPLVIKDPAKFLSELMYQSRVFKWGELGMTGNFGSYIFKPNFIYRYEPLTTNTLSFDIGILFFITSIAGILFSIKLTKLFSFNIAVISFILLFYFAIDIQRIKALRYLLPIVPLLLLYSAYFMRFVINKIPHIKGRPIIIAVILTLFLIPPLYRTISFDCLISHKDTRTLAYDWIMSNVYDGNKIAVFSPYWQNPALPPPNRYVLSLNFYNEGGAAENQSPPSIDELRNQGFTVVVLNSYFVDIVSCPSSEKFFHGTFSNFQKFFQSLENNGVLLKSFKSNNLNKPGPDIYIYSISK